MVGVVLALPIDITMGIDIGTLPGVVGGDMGMYTGTGIDMGQGTGTGGGRFNRL